MILILTFDILEVKMKNSLAITLVLTLFSLANVLSQTPVLWWKMEDSTTNTSKESLTNTDFTINNNRPKPDVITGVAGKALRLNGYLNWIEGAIPANLSATEFTLSVWLALESYPLSTAGIFSNLDNNRKSGVAFLVNKYGQISTSVAINNAFTNSSVTTTAIEKFAWQHLILSVNTTTNTAKIYLNGGPLSTTTLPTGTISWQSNAPFFIGKSTIESFAGIFNTNAVNAAVDELKIFNTALTDAQALTLYQNERPSTIPNLATPLSKYADDTHRPRFHAMPEKAWTNEPHGLTFQNGLWHLFFQKNANGPYWGNLNWGHLTSRNLINWREQKPVLTPKEGYDKEGCWSGTIVLDDNGLPTIYYTGVDGASAQMCLATGNADMSVFQKAANNPIIVNPPVGQAFRDFRDPVVWKENGFWYMLVGSGINSGGSGGTVILYKSTDLRTWEYIRLLKIGHPADDNAGVFWEMPLFVKFPDNRRVLLVNKVPDGSVPAKMLYWTGTFQDDIFTSTAEIPKQLEQDFGHLSPSVYTYPNGRVIAMGIIPDNVNAEFQKEKGYAHTYSLPREWSLSTNGNLKQKPIVELERLRGKNYNYKNVSVTTNQTNVLTEPKGRQIEIRAKIATQNAVRVGFDIAKSADGVEKTRIYYDFITGYLTVDRNASSTNPSVPRGQMGIPYPVNQSDTLDLRIFLDGSVLEVFLNEDIVISTRIFPAGTQSTGIDAFVQGGTANFLNLDVWEMKDMNDPSVSTAETVQQSEKPNLSLFPNPTNDNLSFEFDNYQSSQRHDGTPQYLSFSISNSLGQTVKKWSKTVNETGKQQVNTSLLGLPTGFYILKIQSENSLLTSAKFFKN
jgi:beta-fructofuranosidase